MTDRPIGYWLKQLDRLIDDSFDQLLRQRSLGRREWQVMRALNERPLRPDDLDAEFTPFMASAAPDLETVVAELVARGLVRRDPTSGMLHLTERGEQVHTELWAEVRASRDRMTSGISGQEYQATIDVLARMAGNLQQN
ncbi:MarR family transcriptional regulator [Lipingzhangella sp. LS1_29]|uniref:MarR family transcriptional regulator n=1 Tax=Lipingzhangella rawalii TaxID=2055835 RepID=A0ABU2H107_9ACTN|nr:MarR family transcriptional regulator [Lipingzhangella rawalii]MDS1268986.1 MarR family transcriptional regulator [Lipingzhangella rawalii]